MKTTGVRPPHCVRSGTALCNFSYSGCFADSLHSSDLGLRFCMPPWGAADLHRAAQVRSENMCSLWKYSWPLIIMVVTVWQQNSLYFFWQTLIIYTTIQNLKNSRHWVFKRKSLYYFVAKRETWVKNKSPFMIVVLIPLVPQRDACRPLPTCPSWGCLSCICSLPSLATSPFIVSTLDYKLIFFF